MKTKTFMGAALAAILMSSCAAEQAAEAPKEENKEMTVETADSFEWVVEDFADLRILRYQIPGWDQLTVKQQEYVYYLTQAGYEGRDIIWDQNYRHNLTIRKALENIVTKYDGVKESADWDAFMEYTKRVWFANGIHHHYANYKFTPGFSQEYFESLMTATGTEVDTEVLAAIFDPAKDAKKVSLDSESDLVLSSAINFYDPDITQEEAEAYYKSIIDTNDKQPISYGLNTKLVRAEDGSIKEVSWKADGMYGAAISKTIGWLEKAAAVAENQAQADALKLLIEYYQTGDLKTWDAYNIAWCGATEGDIDYINSFIEVYNDPLGYKGSYETVVQIKDFEASKQMAVVADNVQWFEDNSSIMDEHKKKKVTGVTYKVVTVAGESGDSSPSTPIGVNLPNANWIRATHGSKSVSLGNIISAYDQSSGGSYIEEFGYSLEEIDRAKAYGALGGKLHTALHEVVGHASGQINEGVGTPKETLKNYSSTLEEARADLVALYYLMNEKLIDINLMPTLEVGMAEYDSYIRNGMMVQLRRLKKGEILEEAHMRNRQLVASWAFEQGQAKNVIEKVSKNGKTYFVINDYVALQSIFGDLLREIQRIKSEGDYDAGKALVENYGVQVDPKLHDEVLARSAKLNVPAFSGFVNPMIVPVMEGEKIVGFDIEYAKSFEEQMLQYSATYGNL
ncbi:MAG: dipeptidyl-peptidase 3 family protein [Salibacteraceae bacterium]